MRWLVPNRQSAERNREFIARYTPVAWLTAGNGELEHEKKVLSHLACGSAFYLPREKPQHQSRMNLKEGDNVFAVMKATSVSVEKG